MRYYALKMYRPQNQKVLKKALKILLKKTEIIYKKNKNENVYYPYIVIIFK